MTKEMKVEMLEKRIFAKKEEIKEFEADESVLSRKIAESLKMEIEELENLLCEVLIGRA